MASLEFIDWTAELQTYISINTSQPRPKYARCVQFLVDLVNRMGDPNVTYKVYNSVTSPLLVVTKRGQVDKSVMVCSHMDTAGEGGAGDEADDDWLYPPFAGHYDQRTDRIYGRGTQAVKSQGIQYLAALHRLSDRLFYYTLHIVFVPNGETGGFNGGGMSEFVLSNEFRDLRVQFALDHSCASPFKNFIVFYGERAVWQFVVSLSAPTGHVAMTTHDTCEKKLRRLLAEIDRFRDKDRSANSNENNEIRIGHITTINLTRLETPGVPLGCFSMMPGRIVAYFDMRLGVETNVSAMLNEIDRWMRVANNNKPTNAADDCVTLEWIKRLPRGPCTDYKSNRFCRAILGHMERNNISYTLNIAPMATDGRFLREQGIPVLGFTPINQTPPLLHTKNEFIYRSQFLEHIPLMTELIEVLLTKSQ